MGSPSKAPWDLEMKRLTKGTRLKKITPLLFFALLWACDPPPEEPTIADNVFGPLGTVRPDASLEQKEAFNRGLALSLKRFRPSEGLGPTFNLTFCGGCHEKPTPGGGGPRYRNFLMEFAQLPDDTIVGLGNNGVLAHFGDPSQPFVPTDPEANLLVTRNPIPFYGAGLIAEISGEEIERNADPDDLDGDGISGRANYDRGFVGRFGRKAQTVSIEGFIRGPFFNHLGITSNPLSDEMKSKLPVPSNQELAHFMTTQGALHSDDIAKVHLAQAAAPDEPIVDEDGVEDPELSAVDLFDLVSFVMLMAAPEPTPLSEDAILGEQLFHETGCASCHIPTLQSPRGLIPLYSDLLLHDMGEDLADGVIQGQATGSEFKTPPLWGVVAVGPWLHDGRADTLDEAIRWHGGEAKKARDLYLALRDDQREQVLEFLAHLGGKDQMSSGLLAPGTPVMPVGSNGGPARELTAEEDALFSAGREVFDRDIAMSSGLGPQFNGDSCRACHFEPTIGGAGPLGVNVVRHGHYDPDLGTFTAPAQGTIIHRFSSTSGVRPSWDSGANFFELRQTPALFGLGLINQIPSETIIAGADPEDLDQDGIRGIAPILSDGSLGRYGWKATLPVLEEFVRDALSTEIGLTLPIREDLIEGRTADDDDIADPELSDQDYDALQFFVHTLGPPELRSVDPEQEARGAALFDSIGCGSCHTPELPTADGVPVPLYSDLLLHDLGPEGAPGVEEGAAGMRHYRTTPLWGLRDTAPYLHDGSAETITDAILYHAVEGAASRDAFLSLDLSDVQDLLAFLRSI